MKRTLAESQHFVLDHNKENVSPMEEVCRNTKRICLGVDGSAAAKPLCNNVAAHKSIDFVKSAILVSTPKQLFTNSNNYLQPLFQSDPLPLYTTQEEDYHSHLRNKEVNQQQIRKEFVSKNLPQMYVTKHRGTCTEWLCEVAEAEKISSITVHTATLIMDRYLACTPDFPKNKYQLLAATCFWICAKMEETDLVVPTLHDLCLLCDEQFTKQNFLQMEVLILNSLEWCVSEVTPLHFLEDFVKASISVQESSTVDSANITSCASLLIDLQLQDCNALLLYVPSLVATAAISVARGIIGLPRWNKGLSDVSRYDAFEIESCCKIFERYYSSVMLQDEGQA